MDAPVEQSHTAREVSVSFTSLIGTDTQGAPITKYALEWKKTVDPTYTLIDSVTSPVTVSTLVPST